MAFSIRAMLKLNGQTIPELLHQSAPTTSSLTLGSISFTFSPSTISMSFTPLFNPLSYSSCICFISFSLKAKTNDPLFLYSTLNSSQMLGYILQPRTFSLAFNVPSFASNPPCTIALLALVVPWQTSTPFSKTTVFKSYFDSCLAIALPEIPAPIIATSNILLPPFCPQKNRESPYNHL
ncbi:hypothetical protein SDC9_106757 [bioreactor metagenome]|uniref:Uncharacterized protein n=1 Tax=bioreactor metagenome TaxID=1076179 RepID=A0A645B5L9_9ZZZZ